jgi:hypothetical protein
MKRIYKIFLILLVVAQQAQAQKIVYGEYDRKDKSLSTFEIIGKTGPNFLVFKFYRSQSVVSAYNDDMKLVSHNVCDFFPKNNEVFNVDFVSYADRSILIYQYQKKNIVYCEAANIDSNGILIGKPVVIDTTKISFFATNKIYEFVKSDNKLHLAVVKVQRKGRIANVCLVRFSPTLVVTTKSFYAIAKTEDTYNLKEYGINNNGNFACLFSENDGLETDVTNSASILTNVNLTNKFEFEKLKMPDIYLENLKLKADNSNEKWVMSSFYSTSKRSNIDGIYIYSLPIKLEDSVFSIQHKFSTEIKRDIRGEASTKAALNDFMQRSLLLKKDGGIIISAESYYDRGGRNANPGFNNGINDFRNPNFNNGNTWQQDFYTINNNSVYSYQPINSNSFNSVRYHADNIVVTCYNSNGTLNWSQVISKSQFEDATQNFISYQTFLIGGQMLFFFNKNDQNNWLINVHSISADGQVARLPTLKNLDKGYDFLLRLGKQVNNKTIIVPCKYRNYICFAKIEY